MDIIDKIEAKFGTGGAVFFVVIGGLCVFIAIGVWVWLTVEVSPIIGLAAPFAICGWMLWEALKSGDA
jgi:hypothetical protein